MPIKIAAIRFYPFVFKYFLLLFKLAQAMQW